MTRFLSAVLLVATVCHVASAESPPAKALIGQSFDLIANENPEAPTVGAYRIHAVEDGRNIRVSETLSLQARGKKIEMLSEVVYERNGDGVPIAKSGKARTAMDGQAIMEAAFTIEGRKLSLKASIANPRAEEGAAARKMARQIDLPDGVVLLSSARAVIGPMLQPKPGERAIVWIEFPDDIDEAINVKEGFSLARKATDDGGYTIHVRKGDRDLGPLPFDAKGRIKPHKLFGKYPMREKPIGA